ncbi:hypothetical protein ANCCEY_01216 [Ancylostoma ceylanicum]|uniref:Uncharacterized protein n=1 Tax=Ancylostoma ceylanicum TaxID=53326 RepID=A0A0D6MCX5_9BILA|nr:hypothetical protein ANCCEY_01216 [Ancylostoma ceylanicum]
MEFRAAQRDETPEREQSEIQCMYARQLISCEPSHDDGSHVRPNGERWEREACSRCRMHGAELEGLPCDDTDSARLCITGRCSNSVCHTRQPGSFCDRKIISAKITNPCEILQIIHTTLPHTCRSKRVRVTTLLSSLSLSL